MKILDVMLNEVGSPYIKVDTQFILYTKPECSVYSKKSPEGLIYIGLVNNMDMFLFCVKAYNEDF